MRDAGGGQTSVARRRFAPSELDEGLEVAGRGPSLDRPSHRCHYSNQRIDGLGERPDPDPDLVEPSEVDHELLPAFFRMTGEGAVGESEGRRFVDDVEHTAGRDNDERTEPKKNEDGGVLGKRRREDLCSCTAVTHPTLKSESCALKHVMSVYNLSDVVVVVPDRQHRCTSCPHRLVRHSRRPRRTRTLVGSL
jgi:hypothetical protein